MRSNRTATSAQVEQVVQAVVEQQHDVGRRTGDGVAEVEHAERDRRRDRVDARLLDHRARAVVGAVRVAVRVRPERLERLGERARPAPQFDDRFGARPVRVDEALHVLGPPAVVDVFHDRVVAGGEKGVRIGHAGMRDGDWGWGLGKMRTIPTDRGAPRRGDP